MLTLFIFMVQRVYGERGKRGSLAANAKRPWLRNAIFIFLFLFYIFPNVIIVTRKEGDNVKHEEKSQNCSFWTHILNKKKSTHPLFGTWSHLLVHV